jgi:hypothetical protein
LRVIARIKSAAVTMASLRIPRPKNAASLNPKVATLLEDDFVNAY